MRDTTATLPDSSLHHDMWVHAMRAGDHETAWALCERQAAMRPIEERDDPRLPYHQRWVWDLADLDGRDVLVRCYHGLGDTLQFLRFLPELRRRAASVTLEIQPRLIPLLPLDCADRVVPFDPAHPRKPAEGDIEIMELSFALRMAPNACPPPYLSVEPASLPPGTIGLCCASGDWDSERSIPPELLAPLCRDRPCIALDAQPSAMPVLNPEGCPFDMVETAALVAGCALVITVDTMIAHLAGALGKPVWLLLKHAPDWRWAPETGRSEWYPSARLYAQPAPGDWATVAAQATRDLERIFPHQPEFAR
jgi:Glycosyltransferase family 9 (heptosyltransferase)